MKPNSTDSVLDLLDATVASTALGAAMELGLFWLLDARPLDELGVARRLNIPPVRCHYWLRLLCTTGLIERTPDGYRPSAAAQTAILDAYSHESWALLAAEARERLPILCDLPGHLHKPGSVWDTLELSPPRYLDQMRKDPGRARQFTRMLFEVHQELAGHLAVFLDLDGVSRMIDLGGGSGVMSFALLRRYPELTATVIDIENVCAAGRELAAEASLKDRIDYRPLDFVHDALPTGFDVILECDVNVYGEDLFRKIWHALPTGGRFVIVDQLTPETDIAPPARLHWAFEGSLLDPGYAFPTAAELCKLLTGAGFTDLSLDALSTPPESCRRMTQDMTVIEARK